ncbi:signal peptidase I [Georgenia muralis]
MPRTTDHRGPTPRSGRAAPRPRGLPPALRTAARRLSTLALVAAVLVVAVSATAVVTGRWQAHPVLSGSMEPDLPVGSIAVVQRVPTADLAVGDVITFRDPGDADELITHRIVSITVLDGERVYETKGDANDDPDPWQVTLRGEDSYRLAAAVPYLGYTVVAVRQPEARSALLVAGAGVVLYALVSLFLPDQWWRGRVRAAHPVPVRESEDAP